MGPEGALLEGCGWCDRVGVGERKNWKEETSPAFPYPCLHFSGRKPKSAKSRLGPEARGHDLLLRWPQLENINFMFP